MVKVRVSPLQSEDEAVTAEAPLLLHTVPGQQLQGLEEAWWMTACPGPARHPHLKLVRV